MIIDLTQEEFQFLKSVIEVNIVDKYYPTDEDDPEFFIGLSFLEKLALKFEITDTTLKE